MDDWMVSVQVPFSEEREVGVQRLLAAKPVELRDVRLQPGEAAGGP